MRRSRSVFILLFIGVLLLVTSCSSGKQTQTSNGDLLETTFSTQDLPSFLNGQSRQIKILYQVAAKNPCLLKHIPCYCGCGEMGHASNYNCFINNDKNGKVIWNSHAAKCTVCLNIATESIQAYKKGVSIKKIQEMIDSKYKEGYADPTPTL